MERVDVTYSGAKVVDGMVDAFPGEVGIDSLIEGLGTKFGGVCWASGSGFGCRDMEFDFPSKAEARRFIREVRELGKTSLLAHVHRVKAYLVPGYYEGRGED